MATEGKSCDGISYCPELHFSNLLLWDLDGLTLEKFLADYTLRRYGPKSYDVMRPAAGRGTWTTPVPISCR